jgi:phosphatidylinositol dimannoside acyltransferase
VIEAGRDSKELPARSATTQRRRRKRGAMFPYHAFRAAEAMVRIVPHRLAYRIGDVAAGVVTRTQPQKFDGLRANLRHVVPEAGDAQLEKLTRRNVRNLVRAWIDVLEMRHKPDLMVSRLNIIDLQHLHDTFQRGRGAIVVSLHLGAWEHGIAAYNKAYGSMALLAESLDPPELFERIAQARTALGVKVIPVDLAGMRNASDPRTARMLGASALKDVYKVLRGNGCVAIAMDRDIAGNGEPMEFFGAPAPIPVGVIELGIRTGAALVPVMLYRNGHTVDATLYPEIAYDPDAPREAEVRRCATEAVRLFEKVIRDHPDQWHVLDPIWPEAPSAT